MRSGSSRKLVGDVVRKQPPLEVALSVEGIEQLAGLQALRDRVDGEVTPPHVVLERDGAVGDDLEVVAARAGRPLGARRRELDPRGRKPAHLTVAREQADADVLSRDDEILDAAVRRERGPQLGVTDLRNDEVGVADRLAEELIADGAAHHPRVEPQRADVLGDRMPRHRGAL